MTTPHHRPDRDRMPQLDGLRGLAVFGVVVSHWTPDFLVGIVPWGTGVQLFFVLSGFLITDILLRSRAEESGTSLGAALRIFYIRRALRIFPIYYAVLAVSIILGLGSIRETWPWHVGYLSNFFYAFNQHGDMIRDPFLHFWSLGVEEQFYLFWPLVALTLSRRALPVVLALALVVAVIFRTQVEAYISDTATIRYLTPACFDAFAVGGLIAYVGRYHSALELRRLGWGLAVCGIGGLMLSVGALPRLIDDETAHRIGHTFLVIFYGALVAGAAQGFRGVLGRVLEFRPLLYLGMVSYGVYIYHYFAPLAVNALTQRWGGEVWQRPAVLLVLYVLFTLTVSAVSWHGFEAPINRLKRRFPYPKSVPPAVAAAPVLSRAASAS